MPPGSHAGDFLAPELPYESRSNIEGDYPLTVNAGDASYRAEYDLSRNQVTLQLVKGSRGDPPPLNYLPKFPGLRILVEGHRGLSVVRARGWSHAIRECVSVSPVTAKPCRS